jgi:hypothetical protein
MMDREKMVNSSENEEKDITDESGENNNKMENHALAMYGCNDNWTFSKRDRSQEVYLSNNYRTAHFHPNWSKGTAGGFQLKR